MTKIDWTKPVETDEDPPRSVRVLFDKDGRAQAVWLEDENDFIGIKDQDGECEDFTLRNVAPPKPQPFLREAWVVFKEPPNCWVFTDYSKAKFCADANGFPMDRAAVMSDGSPAPGEEPDLGAMSILQMEKQGLTEQRDHWKAKAEVLQEEVNQLSIAGMVVELKAQVKLQEDVIDAMENDITAHDEEIVVLQGLLRHEREKVAISGRTTGCGAQRATLPAARTTSGAVRRSRARRAQSWTKSALGAVAPGTSIAIGFRRMRDD